VGGNKKRTKFNGNDTYTRTLTAADEMEMGNCRHVALPRQAPNPAPGGLLKSSYHATTGGFQPRWNGSQRSSFGYTRTAGLFFVNNALAYRSKGPESLSLTMVLCCVFVGTSAPFG
jgi:hypothetical protein